MCRARFTATSRPTTRICAAWRRTDPALVAKAQDRWYVPDPNKAQDLEKKREKALLKEFETYQGVHRSQDQGVAAGGAARRFPRGVGGKDYATIIASPTSCRRKRCKRTRSCSPSMTSR
jgi:hypothetical protein